MKQALVRMDRHIPYAQRMRRVQEVIQEVNYTISFSINLDTSFYLSFPPVSPKPSRRYLKHKDLNT